MGMFGLVYTSFVLFCKGIVGIQNKSYDFRSKMNAENNGKVCYYDHNGAYRTINDNTPAQFKRLDNGDRAIVDWNNKIVKNFDKNERERRFNQYMESVNKNNEVLCIGRLMDVCVKYKDSPYKNMNGWEAVFKRKDDGKLYLRTQSGRLYRYMSLDDGLIYYLNQVPNEGEKKLLDHINNRLSIGLKIDSNYKHMTFEEFPR